MEPTTDNCNVLDYQTLEMEKLEKSHILFKQKSKQIKSILREQKPAILLWLHELRIHAFNLSPRRRLEAYSKRKKNKTHFKGRIEVVRWTPKLRTAVSY